MAQLTVKNVTLGYGGHIVSKDINFTVNAGDFLCIVGENGCGKSTLMKSILRLTAPIGGQILFGDGITLRDIGYLPQQTAAQWDFPASVEEIVYSGCLNRVGWRPFYSKEEKMRAQTAMKKMGILPLRKRCYRELSGGQQQRVLLARALCAAHKMLLLDEPTAGLDPKVTAQMYEWIRQLHTEEPISVVMISHDIATALIYATHILHLAEQPLFFGTAEEYKTADIGKAFAVGEEEAE